MDGNIEENIKDIEVNVRQESEQLLIKSKLDLIYRNLADVIGSEFINDKLASNRHLLGYIGFAPTGQR